MSEPMVLTKSGLPYRLVLRPESVASSPDELAPNDGDFLTIIRSQLNGRFVGLVGETYVTSKIYEAATQRALDAEQRLTSNHELLSKAQEQLLEVAERYRAYESQIERLQRGNTIESDYITQHESALLKRAEQAELVIEDVGRALDGETLKTSHSTPRNVERLRLDLNRLEIDSSLPMMGASQTALAWIALGVHCAILSQERARHMTGMNLQSWRRQSMTAEQAFAQLQKFYQELTRMDDGEPLEEGERQPKIHTLKTWLAPFQAIVDGSKSFEVRRDDRDFHVGDELVLQEYDPRNLAYSVRLICKRVSYKLTQSVGLREGYCVLGIEDPPDESVTAAERDAHLYPAKLSLPKVDPHDTPLNRCGHCLHFPDVEPSYVKRCLTANCITTRNERLPGQCRHFELAEGFEKRPAFPIPEGLGNDLSPPGLVRKAAALTCGDCLRFWQGELVEHGARAGWRICPMWKTSNRRPVDCEVHNASPSGDPCHYFIRHRSCGSCANRLDLAVRWHCRHIDQDVTTTRPALDADLPCAHYATERSDFCRACEGPSAPEPK